MVSTLFYGLCFLTGLKTVGKATKTVGKKILSASYRKDWEVTTLPKKELKALDEFTLWLMKLCKKYNFKFIKVTPKRFIINDTKVEIFTTLIDDDNLEIKLVSEDDHLTDLIHEEMCRDSNFKEVEEETEVA